MNDKIPHVTVENQASFENWCVHYNGLLNRLEKRKCCEAGVEYESVKAEVEFTYSRKDGHVYKGRQAHPCFKHEHALTKGCEKCRFPNAEEVKNHNEEMKRYFNQVDLAREAIIKDCRNEVGIRGSVTCPVCKIGTLNYSRASSNGHVHAACSTPNCVRWME